MFLKIEYGTLKYIKLSIDNERKLDIPFFGIKFVKNMTKHSAMPKKLGDYLLESKLITPIQLKQALESHFLSGKMLPPFSD